MVDKLGGTGHTEGGTGQNFPGAVRDYHRAQGGKNRIDKYVMEEQQKEEQAKILQEQKEILSELKEVRTN
jgi:hypothetical protein